MAQRHILSTDATALKVFEKKAVRQIFGPVRVGDDFRIRFNSELYELLNDIATELAVTSTELIIILIISDTLISIHTYFNIM